MKKKIFLIIVCLIFIVLFMFLYENNIWDKNAKLFKKEVLSLDSNITELTLKELTPFDWDEVYIFRPYNTKEYIYTTIGYKWDNVNEIVDGMIQVVFLKNKEVICYLTGYPDKNKYDIVTPITKFSPNKLHLLLLQEDNTKLEIERKDNITFLTIL